MATSATKMIGNGAVRVSGFAWRLSARVVKAARPSPDKLESIGDRFTVPVTVDQMTE
jgi:hypothetical protein